MSKTDILEELPKLNPEDRFEILDRICQLDSGDWTDGGELTAREKSILDARLAEFETNPESGSSWEEVAARIGQKLSP